MSSIKSGNSLRRTASRPNTLASGAIDEEVFHSAFSAVSSLPIYSARDLSEYMGKIKDSLSLNPEAWEKRCEALKMLRNVVSSGGPQMEEFNVLLRSLVSAVDNCLRDLRSQVVREGCITVAYMSQELGNRFDYFAEMILQTLINLIPNSAKIMSTSGIAAINFIIRNTYAPRLLPIIFSGLTSKSAVVRRYMCVFLEPIIQLWPENMLEKHMGPLQESLRKGLGDANQDARSATRSAFQVFARRFPANADSVLQSLDPLTKKMVEKAISGDGSGSTSEASSLTNLTTTARTRPGNTGPAKRINMPALGSSGISSIASSKPTNGTTSVIDRSRSKVGQFNTMRARSSKKMVSQSQPASRETSPSSRAGSEYAYVPSTGYGRLATPRAAGYAAGVPASIRRTSDTLETGRQKGSFSRLPKSQASSRDTSPNSGYAASPYRPDLYGTERPQRVSATATGYHPVGSAMSDVGAANDSSGYYRQQDSDDNASEASSMCSSRSGRSAPSSRRLQTLRSITGFNDMVSLLSSAQWAEKKDGLIHLNNHIRSDQTFSQPEVIRIAEVLSQIFRDSSSKVFSLFMETLQAFIKRYNQYLHEWIYGTLVRLFTRQARELSTHQKAIQDTLNVIRSHFPLSLQFQCCFHFIIDDAVAPSLKVKACVLEYLKDLIIMLPVEVMNNPSPDVIKGVTRVIGWSTEPKSPDVRRLASRVVIKLSDLNPTAFTSYIQQMPANFQNQASKLLKTYQKKTNLSGTETISPTGLTASQVAKLPTSRPFSPVSACHIPQQAAYPPPGDSMGYGRGHSSSSSVTDGYMEPRQPNYPPPHYRQQFGSQQQHYFSNPDGYNSGIVHNQFPVAGDGMFSQASNSPNHQQAAAYGPDLSYQQQQQQQLQQIPDMSPNNNNLYQSPPSILSGLRNEPLYTKLKKPVIGYQTLKKIREMPPEDAITEILQELSNYNQRYEQRKACMLKLIKLLRDGSIDTWSEHSKPTLLILLESLCDNSGETRALALRVLQELVRTQGDLVSEYACLTVMKILECCGDYDKAVVRAAEECAFTVARNLPQDLCLHLLTTIITDKQTTLRLPAIKMQTEVIKFSSPEAVEVELSSLIPDLVALCGHDDSHVRKASIFCLVQIAIKFGDDIWEYLKGLNASKKRLLRIYIDKEREGAAFSESVQLSGNIPIH